MFVNHPIPFNYSLMPKMKKMFFVDEKFCAFLAASIFCLIKFHKFSVQQLKTDDFCPKNTYVEMDLRRALTHSFFHQRKNHSFEFRVEPKTRASILQVTNSTSRIARMNKSRTSSEFPIKKPSWTTGDLRCSEFGCRRTYSSHHTARSSGFSFWSRNLRERTWMLVA